MNTGPESSLEIQIHLCDGNITRFRQCDPLAARAILRRAQPDKVFAQRHLILAGDHSVSVYPCSAVSRIDFVMEGFPDWPFHRNVTDMLEITPDEFRARYDPRTARTGRPVQPGDAIRVFGELELDHGQRIFREVHIRVPEWDSADERVPLDRNIFYKQLFLAPGLHFRRRGGGAVLINPAHVVRMTFYPGPSQPPENAWSVESDNHPWENV